MLLQLWGQRLPRSISKYYFDYVIIFVTRLMVTVLVKKAAWRALERSMGLVTDAKAVNFLFLPSEHDRIALFASMG